jgi:hypothetical protein
LAGGKARRTGKWPPRREATAEGEPGRRRFPNAVTR